MNLSAIYIGYDKMCVLIRSVIFVALCLNIAAVCQARMCILLICRVSFSLNL